MVLLTSQDVVLKTGDKAPDFLLPGVDDKKYSLKSFKDRRALLIIFMCNHCPYVIPKMDYFVELQERYMDQGLQIVGINANDPVNYPSDSLESMKKVAKEKHFNFPYLFDESQNVPKKYGAVCTPDPYLFDGNLRLVYHGRFDDAHGKEHGEGTTSEMDDAIKQVLIGEEVTVEKHPSMGCSIKWKE